jgi:hypothetical protein
MPETKHYVYSARTTEKGLALLNKVKGGMGWDRFINEAIAAHYKINLNDIMLPPSQFLAKREEKRKAKEAERAEKAAEKKAKEKPKKVTKKTTKEAKENGKQ